MIVKIISMPSCPKCQSLRDMCQDTTAIDVDMPTLLAFAKQVDVRSMPFLVVAGEPAELAKIVEAANEI